MPHLDVDSIFARDYQIIRKLAQGGMGAVYEARQLSTGKQRALKLMLPELVDSPGLRERFAEEARVGSRIDSEHVVEVVGAGVDDETSVPWLAMELLRGEELSKRIGRVGALSWEETLEFFGHLAHAMGAAHAANVTHRDLKPENLFIAESKSTDGRPRLKVLDFGLARVTAEARTSRTSRAGTPGWWAPEQTGRGTVGPQADVWAIGLIVFHALTGRVFWRAWEEEGATDAHLLREMVHDPIPPASSRAAELGRAGTLPEGFDVWFARSLERDVTSRFANATIQFAGLRALDAPLAPPAPEPGVVHHSDTVSEDPRGFDLTAAPEASEMSELEFNLLTFLCISTIVSADGKITPAEQAYLNQIIRPLSKQRAVLEALEAIPDDDGIAAEHTRLLHRARSLGSRTKTALAKWMLHAAKADRKVTREEIDAIRFMANEMDAVPQAERVLTGWAPDKLGGVVVRGG